MKISIITSTYNRGNIIGGLYTSIIKNLEKNKKVEAEWIIMNDGSTDNTKEKIKSFINEKKLEIKYFEQSNSGKMAAINYIVGYATGELLVECDSDDEFSDDAFDNIEEAYKETKGRNDLYGLCFLKYDLNRKNIGSQFKNDETTMFDLYFKEEEKGEKAIVFFTEIRKKYKYKIENNEKFSTEARMYHEMDLTYKMKCYNKPIMICDYKEDGYTKNIMKIFKNNPYGHFEYFKEILQRDMKGVKFKKRLYVIKHYILFATLIHKTKILEDINGIQNKILICILYLPGKLATKNKFYNK
ncbi:MAG: glycosyltransferase family A protein [Clostridia bacterium]